MLYYLPMNTVYDVLVVGLGAMGSASVYQLAKSELKVVGIDQFEPPHVYGSSHGETRITRQSIAEGKEYVPLVLRANKIWEQLERETGEVLYTKTGILIMSSNTTVNSNKFVDSTVAAAREYAIPHEVLTAETIKKRFPQFNIQGDERGYFEEGAGFLSAENCIRVQLRRAAELGALLNTNEKMLAYTQNKDFIQVKTNKAVYNTKKLVLTLGPWVRNILPNEYTSFLKIYRQVLYWFELRGNPKDYVVGKFPVFNWEFNTAHEDFIYGFPSLDGKSIKIATEQYDRTTDPSNVDKIVTDEEKHTMYEQYVRPHFQDISQKCLKAEACMYTVAPDWQFLIDYMPGNSNIIVASPCSGHGFKHSAAIGEVISQMVQEASTTVDINKFSFNNVFAKK